MNCVVTSNSSVAANVNITCKRGDDFSRIFRFWQDEGKTIPFDISGSSFKMSVLNNSGTSILPFEMGNGLEITSTNELTASKTPTQMLIDSGNYLYDLQKTVNGQITTLLDGIFTIEKDITQ